MRKPVLIEHKGKTIIYLDFSNLRKLQEIKELETEGGKIIRQRNIHSALVLSNLEHMYFNHEIRTHFIKVARENTSFVKASAVIGLYGMIAFVFNGFLEASSRNIRSFKTMAEALEYLTSFD
ncbi:hypothetical protein [Roseimarinus sediminis]|uniref:hypothetical protein n=1 Tax=Roseimarinus sediminis TaxID=1610899 RepID=UPI003D1D7306